MESPTLRFPGYTATRAGRAHVIALGLLLGPAVTIVPAVAAPTVSSPAVAGPTDTPLVVQPLRPSLHLVTGAGGNVVVWAGTGGTVLVDSGHVSRTTELLAAVARVAPARLRFVVNTQGHPDHTGGNAALATRGAVVIGHESLRDTGWASAMDANPDNAADGHPVITVTESLSLHLDGEQIDVAHVADAHTSGDLVVRWMDADVIDLGDIYYSQQYPVIDLDHGGSLAGMVAAVEGTIARAGARTLIVPGHGAPTGRAELAGYRDMLVTVGRKVREAVERGETLQQVLASGPTSEFDTRFAPEGSTVSRDDFVRTVYHDLTRRR